MIFPPQLEVCGCTRDAREKGANNGGEIVDAKNLVIVRPWCPMPNRICWYATRDFCPVLPIMPVSSQKRH